MLRADLISQFVKITKDDKKTNNETTAYGTIKTMDDVQYVQLDGSDILTPIDKAVNAEDNERVSVLIKDHTATVVTNRTSPSTTTTDLGRVNDDIVAESVRVNTLLAGRANIDDLIADKATIGELEVIDASILGILKADNAELKNITASKVDTTFLEANYATIDQLDVEKARIYDLESTYISADDLEADRARITNLEATKIDATEVEAHYANIDFANIGYAAAKKIFSDYGVITEIEMEQGTVTKQLTGVRIDGDLINANTLRADTLLLQGDDGLYYQLNVNALGQAVVDSLPPEEQENLKNGIHGSNIIAESIAADKISVSDLVAFDATIGGFHISDHSLYSGAKTSAKNTTRGVFLGDEGEFAVGDSNNYLRYYKDTDNKYKLELAADSVKMGTSSRTLKEELDDIRDDVTNINVITSVTNYYLAHENNTGVTRTNPSTGWTSTMQLTDTTKRYLWCYQKITYSSGDPTYSIPVVIGTHGATGEPGTPGETGKGVSAITNYYLASSSASGITKDNPSTGWTETMQSTSASKKYLWCYQKITYTSGNPTYTTAVIIGTHGDNGAQGTPGEDAITITITPSNGTIFKETTDSTTLTVSVFKGGVLQNVDTDGTCGDLGTVKWYATTPIGPVEVGGIGGRDRKSVV